MPKPKYGRNRDILNAYKRGNTMAEVARSYRISTQAVSVIIDNVKNYDKKTNKKP
tara:strand:- start:901 stop:1065 length:165 start_codon:yes stop_codon:yes gene_type:complete